MNESTNDKEILNIEKLTLDTHILLWYSEGIKLTKDQIDLIEEVRKRNALYISSISIWEISMLASKDKIAFSIPLVEWIDKVLSIPGINSIDLSPSILYQSCNLPNFKHKDPADRFIIASARFINSHLMTYDKKIIDYANAGYIKIVPTHNNESIL